MSECKFKREDNLNKHKRLKSGEKWSFWVLGIGSLVWLLLRSGAKIRRLAYPCQHAALLSSLGFIGYLLSILGSTYFYRRLRQGATIPNALLFALAILITSGITSSVALPAEQIYASPTLPAWLGTSAVSNVFAVTDVPVPECSLDGGSIPASPPCNTPTYAFADQGVDNLVNLMEAQGNDYFYKTAVHPNGIVGSDDVVVLKINNQWGGRGSDTGLGRLSTNTDVLKGLIWRILQHPDSGGFTGEIVIAENAQPVSSNSWDLEHYNNAQDQDQSYQDVVLAFHHQGYTNTVSLYDWTDLNDDRINGGNIGDIGDPNNITGEYINGNNADAYIMLEDPAKTATNEYSYPKFQTANGSYVSMRYGVWNGSSYDSDRLAFINMPVLKRHTMAGATIAWKNLIGFVNADGFGSNRYGDWYTMHDYYWGHTSGDTYGLIGREIALIRAPDLHLIDAIWVATQNNNKSNVAVRQDVLLASTDPFAVDWYASEYVLHSIPGVPQETSAARSGTFRNATRINQNAAAVLWPGGSYPYIDLLDAYDGSTPSDDEKNQMNVYVNVYNNTAPTAVNDDATTDEGTAVVIDVLANDTASAGRTLDPSSVTVTTPPGNGNVSPNPDGTITYTPNTGFSGSDSFVYQVCDDATPAECDTATVAITVNQTGTVVPLTGVAFSGPAQGSALLGLTYIASATPYSATQPITYTWGATEQETVTRTGGLSDTRTFTWDTMGTKHITVTANNASDMPLTAYRSIVINQEGTVVPPSDLVISGPAQGSALLGLTFIASTTPNSVTQPITYTWQATAQDTYTRTGGLSDEKTFIWTTAGTKHITVTANNRSNTPLSAQRSIAITPPLQIYLPIVLKN